MKNPQSVHAGGWRKRAILAGSWFFVLAGTVLLSAFFTLSAGNRPCQLRNSLQCCRLSNSFAGEICGAVSVVPYYFRRVYNSNMLKNKGEKFSYSSYCLRDSHWRLRKITRSNSSGCFTAIKWRILDRRYWCGWWKSTTLLRTGS